MSTTGRRMGLVLALLIALSPFLVEGANRPAPRAQAFKGKVVPLSTVIARAGGKLDADAAPAWLALVGDDGKVYPLVKDSGSRMFFKDRTLLDRPMQLTGWLVPGSTLLRVGSVNSVRKGVLHEVYYWCDICSIKRGEKNICECCGAAMDLHEDPVKR